MSERVPTGVPGLDDLISGGLPRGRSILLSGTCGTGKSTLAIQYLVNGATQYNEPGIMITLEQNADELRQDMLHFGLDLNKLEGEKKIIIIDTSLSKIGIKDYLTSVPTAPDGSFSLLPDEFDIDKIVNIIVNSAQKIGAKRVVIDSLPALDYILKEDYDIRRALINLNYELKKHNLTALLITESLEDDGISKHGVEEYVVDGVIVLRTNEALDTRTLKIRKMRVTDHSLKPTTFEITPKGITIKPPKGL